MIWIAEAGLAVLAATFLLFVLMQVGPVALMRQAAVALLDLADSMETRWQRENKTVTARLVAKLERSEAA